MLGRTRTGRELGSDDVTEQERDTATGLLVQRHLERASNGVLAAVDVAGQQDDETLLVSRRVRLAEDGHDGLVREPVGDGLSGSASALGRQMTYSARLEATPELGAADVERLGAGGDLV